jgi:hypothetical protein
VEADLRTYVLAQTEISALIGSRMYLQKAPQGASLPLIIFSLQRSSPNHHLRGYSGVTEDTIEIECQSYTDVGAKDLKEKVRKKLQGYRGVMGSTFVNSCFITDESDHYTDRSDASDKGIFIALLEFTTWHTETAPTV